MIPSKKELLPFINEIEAAAEYFDKSSRTVRRWLQHYEIYCPQEKYRPGKVTPEMAMEIRRLEKENLTQAEIAQLIGISQPMVGRIINNGLKFRGQVDVVFRPNR